MKKGYDDIDCLLIGTSLGNAFFCPPLGILLGGVFIFKKLLGSSRGASSSSPNRNIRQEKKIENMTFKNCDLYLVDEEDVDSSE